MNDTLTAEQALDMLIKAINKVPKKYYQIRQYNDEIRFRERLFCYELYHQFRIVLDNKQIKKYILHGELAKSGNPLFKGEIPDFLLHIPNDKCKNLLIIEVKLNYDEDGIKNDFKKLFDFIKDHNYKRGVFLYVIEESDKYEKTIREILISKEKSVLEKIHIIHKSPSQEIISHKTASELLEEYCNARPDS